MANKTTDKKKNKNLKKSALNPDPETLHTTDPQEHMKGPVSSTVQNIKHNGEKSDEVSKEEASRKRDEKM